MRSKRNSPARRTQALSEIYRERISRLQLYLQDQSIDVCLIDAPVDLLYLTGLKLSAGRLLVHREDCHLFVDGRYIESALKNAPTPVSLDQEENLHAFLAKIRAKKVGCDTLYISYDRFIKWQALLKKWAIALVALPHFYKSLRLIKDHQEIAYMRASAKLLYRGFEEIRKRLKRGVSEEQIARAFEIFCLENGAEKMAFEPIIAFGPNSAMPHYRAGGSRLKKGQMILIDIGVVVSNYHSDMTRVLFFESIDPFFATVYEVVRASQKAALALCKPGVAIGELDRAARLVMKRHQMESHFLHSLGHGIGLQTHEFPRIKYDTEDKDLILKPGMVITIEPGLYFAGQGGIRYEDTVVVTENGYESFFPEMKKNHLLIKGS